MTNTVEETTVETVLEDEDIHLGIEEDQDPHHVQYQEDNQERYIYFHNSLDNKCLFVSYYLRDSN